MPTNPRHDAQRRADRISAFRAELADLAREGGPVLTPDQQRDLNAYHDALLARLAAEFGADVTVRTRRIAWGARIVTLLGAAALFAAGTLFLHRIWGFVPTPARTLVLVLAPLVPLAAAALIARPRTDPFYPALLAWASGFAFFFASGALAAVHNTVPPPHLLAGGAVFAIAIAYALELRALLGIGLALACLWTAALWSSLHGHFWPAVFETPTPVLPAVAVLYTLPTLRPHRNRPEFDPVYRVTAAALGLAALLLLSQTGDPCCSILPRDAYETGCQLLGLALAAGAVAHGLRLASPGLVNLGAIGFVVFLFVRLQGWWWDWMPRYLFFLALGGIAFAILVVFRQLHRRLARTGSPP